MGDQNHGSPALAGQVEHQLDDQLARLLVEIARRFIGEQQRRVGDHRAGKPDALLLATGHRGRVVVEPLAQADRGECGTGALSDLGHGQLGRGDLQRQPDIVPGGKGGDQVEALGKRCRWCCAGTAPTRPR